MHRHCRTKSEPGHERVAISARIDEKLYDELMRRTVVNRRSIAGQLESDLAELYGM